jgi:hypothetical protein
MCVHYRVSSEPRALPRALQNTEWALRPGRPRWLLVHASRPPVHVEQATCHVSRAAKATVGLGPVPILARWPGNSKIPFLFFIWFQTEFKLQKFVSKYLELKKL